MGQNGSKWVKMGQKSLFWALLGPREPQKAEGNRPRAAKRGSKGHKMCFGTVLYHLDAILLHFEPKLKIIFFFDFEAILGHFGSFLGPLGASGALKGRGGTGQERPKGGQKAIEMCFGTVLDHLDTILVHFEPKPKIEIFSILRPFWAFFGPLNSAKSFWGPPPLPQH